ncbi:MAG: hypothetical protein Q7T53_00925 [Deltaproteobacteria bacterium]|nr:hypothetical protein [Deltaproteobacteria bacterium]
MKKSYSFWLFIGCLLAGQLVLAGMKYPAPLYSTGDLVEAHAKLRCKDCHAPFKLVASESCSVAKCHPEGKIGKKPAVIDLHNRMKGKDCLICHTDHLGQKGKITKGMDHDAFKYSKCMDCHSGEGDKAHKEKYAGDCSECHNTKKWKEITFNHARVSARLCLDCHNKVPKDDMHEMGAIGSCGDCHGTKAWKPSTYNHDKYFFLDKDHKVTCIKCHDTRSYKKYTCMNCHEHSSRGIIAEHREEGIKGDIGRCLDCHRVNMGGRTYGTDKTGEGEGMGSDKEDDD